MDRDQIIIMLDRLVENRGGDIRTLKRFLMIREGRMKYTTPAPMWHPLLAFGVIGLVIFQLRLIDDGSGLANWIIYSIIGAEVLGSAWILHLTRPKRANRNTRNKYGMQPHCESCGYELNPDESALGKELWVGPTQCPKCEHKYPAVHS